MSFKVQGKWMLTSKASFDDGILYKELISKNITYSNSLITDGQICGLLFGLLVPLAFAYKFIKMQIVKDKPPPKQYKSQHQITFKDIGGNAKAKEALLEIVDYIKNPEVYEEIGFNLPKGVLLYGPPGTGKTLLAKAVANECKVPFIYACGSEFVEIFVGNGAKRI